MLLSENYISKLPLSVFDGLPSLLELNLRKNEISILSIDTFKKLPLLQKLFIQENRLISLPVGLFDSLSNLTMLYLQDNYISVLYVGIFDNLSTLQILDISFNTLTSLSQGVFDKLTVLTTLLLSSNKLSILNIGIFSGLKSLNVLNLEYNEMTLMAVEIFAELTVLTNLNLGHNSNHEFYVGLFDHLTALVYLDLQYNLISILSVGLFDSLQELSELFLFCNQISTIPTGLFDKLTKLKTLHLDNNKLTYIAADTFAELRYIVELDLDGNYLSCIDKNAFQTTLALRSLSISNNMLTELPNISKLFFLHTLCAHNNNIFKIDASIAPVVWPNIIVLSFENNPSICTRIGLGSLNGSTNAVICNCAPGFIGLSYCTESLSGFPLQYDPFFIHLNSFTPPTLVIIPEFISFRFLFIEDYASILKQHPGFDLNYFYNASPVYEYFSFRDVFNPANIFLFKFNVASMTFEFSLWVIYTVFNYDHSRMQQRFFPDKVITANISLGQSAFELPAFTIEANVDYTFPTNITYIYQSQLMPPNISGLVYYPEGSAAHLSGVITYQKASDPHLFKFNITAMDTISGEKILACVFSITVYDCPQEDDGIDMQKCNGGLCIDFGTPHDGNYYCDCSNLNENSINDITIGGEACGLIIMTSINYTIFAWISIIAVLICFVAIRVLIYTKKLRNMKCFHVFISYRRNTDSDIAQNLCTELQKHYLNWNTAKNQKIRVKCFLDSEEIALTVQWKSCFVRALNHSCLYVPIISEAAVVTMKTISSSDKKTDNLLYEFELANKLKKENRICILPIFVGGGDTLRTKAGTRALNAVGDIVKFDMSEYGTHTFPANGSPTSNIHVSVTLHDIYSCQGVKLVNVKDLRIIPLKGENCHLISVLMETLNQTSWSNAKNPTSCLVEGKKNWLIEKNGIPFNNI